MNNVKKVLIFGKDGQLGYDLTRVFGDGYKVISLGHGEVDITNAFAVGAVIKNEKPWLIINATAYNKVEQAGSEKELAFGINEEGVGNIAKACKEEDAVFVHVSTDYIFDGSKDLFVEEDLTHPLNVYGESKLAGEQIVKSISPKYYIIRTSAVFGKKQSSQKLNFVDRMISLATEGQELKVVSDQFSCPTYSLDLAEKIQEMSEKQAPFGIYHITNSGSCSWYEFAEKILELKGIKVKVEPVQSDFTGKVNRPMKSILKDTKLEALGIPAMPTWQDALGRYLKEKYQ